MVRFKKNIKTNDISKPKKKLDPTVLNLTQLGFLQVANTLCMISQAPQVFSGD